MKTAHKLFGFLASFAIIFILLVTAFDVACYSDFDFYQEEYEKYGVLDDLSMEMDDVMEVTRHMMAYLRGQEDSLQITTTVDGETMDFFNDQDLFHMAEVKDLFLGMFRIRTICIVILVLSLIALFATHGDGRTLFRCFQYSLAIFIGLAVILGIIVAVNFSQAFVVFHHLFFDNDLWLFDPSTDLMINMLPEGLFMDFTVRILGFFVLFLVLFEAVLLIFNRIKKSSLKKARTASCLLLAFCLFSSALSGKALADDLTDLPEWPAGPEVQADAAILMDARTGNILYAKNIDTAYPPASITKIVTALIACEQANLSDTVVYSHNAVYSLPWDSSIVGFSEDEAVSMRDSLYGLMLASGNEAAIGIAEHIAGSTEAFAEMMNERARQAGATNSNFVNPNGLHDDNHYTTCRDMALIMRDAIQNEAFLELASTTTYDIAPTNINPNGYHLQTGHRMLLENRQEYYEFAVAGKTGYTSNAGNTLVTYAKNGDMELICVVMHSIQTHYSDTRALFDYGFGNFTCYNAAEEDSAYSDNSLNFFSFLSSAFEKMPVSVQLDDNYITLPSTIPFSSLDSHLEYSEEGEGDDNILGYVCYAYQGIEVGRAALRLVSTPLPESTGEASGTPGEISSGESAPSSDPALSPSASSESAPAQETPRVITINVWHLCGYIFLAVLAFLLLTLFIRFYSPKQRRRRRARQMRRVYMSGERRRRKKRRELR